MTLYIVVGKSDSTLLAECEALAELVVTQTRNIKVQTVIKYPDDWPEFAEKVCNTYGFKINACPFVFTSNGKLIGEAQDFIDHVRKEYGIKTTLTQDQIQKRTESNILF